LPEKIIPDHARPGGKYRSGYPHKDKERTIEHRRGIKMRQSSVGSLPGDDHLFDDHYDHDHPGIDPNATLIVHVFEDPAHGPAEDPDRKEKLHRLYPRIDPQYDSP